MPELAQARIAVLHGGTSREHEVSLESGAGIHRALASTIEPGALPGPREVLEVRIEKDGTWVVEGCALGPLEALGRLSEVDLFFLGLHGGDGENGNVQALLQALGFAYTGSGVAASALCMDKHLSRELVRAEGLGVPAGRLLTRSAPRPGGDLALDTLGPGGWVVKPRCGGSSVGVSLVLEPEELGGALDAAFALEDDVLLEELVPGVEVSVGVLDLRGEGPRGLPPVEITPREGGFYDYEEKYSEASAALACPPPSLTPEMAERLSELGLRAHRALGCEGYSRTDFIVPPGGEPVFLETNTLPGMTSHSLLPCEAERIGVDYRTLCLWIAMDGLARGRRS